MRLTKWPNLRNVRFESKLNVEYLPCSGTKNYERRSHLRQWLTSSKRNTRCTQARYSGVFSTLIRLGLLLHHRIQKAAKNAHQLTTAARKLRRCFNSIVASDCLASEGREKKAEEGNHECALRLSENRMSIGHSN